MNYLPLAALAVLLTACSVNVPPDIISDTDPSSPTAPVKPVRYVPVTAGTVDYRPVEPKPWIEQNQQVAPTPSPVPEPEGQ